MRVLSGDIFQSQMQTIVNTVNCDGVMGKGLALSFKQRYPAMYRDYAERCREGKVRPGEPYLYTDLTGLSILNFPTKLHWRNPSQMSYISDGLDWFVEHYQALGISSIAFSALGCGNGGLAWSEIGPLMVSKLGMLPIDIEIYAPYGVPREQTTLSYLQEHAFRDATLMLPFIYNAVGSLRYAMPLSLENLDAVLYLIRTCGILTTLRFSSDGKEIRCDNADTVKSMLKEKGLLTNVDTIPFMPMDLCDLANEMSRECYVSAKRVVDFVARMKGQEELRKHICVLYAGLQSSTTSVPDTVAAVRQTFPALSLDDEEIREAVEDVAMIGWLKIQIEDEDIE
ncbi:MAG: macro domain-containing protein [Clostridia bacterium]|nr:macro domain-containing protein [Clostridia bacterium]